MVWGGGSGSTVRMLDGDAVQVNLGVTTRVCLMWGGESDNTVQVVHTVMLRLI